jgi:hypothetical protein
VDRASSAINLLPDGGRTASKESSAFGFGGRESQQKDPFKDFVHIDRNNAAIKNPLTNIEVQRKVAESKDCAVQVTLLSDSVRYTSS